MGWTPPTTWIDGGTPTGAEIEGNAQGLRDHINGNGSSSAIAAADIASDAIRLRHLVRPAFESVGRLLVWRGVSGLVCRVDNPAANLSRLKSHDRYEFQPNGCLASPIFPDDNYDTGRFRPVPKLAIDFELDARADVHVRWNVSIMAPEDNTSPAEQVSRLGLVVDGTFKDETRCEYREAQGTNTSDADHRYVQGSWTGTGLAQGKHTIYLATAIRSHFALLGGSFLSVEAFYRRS